MYIKEPQTSAAKSLGKKFVEFNSEERNLKLIVKNLGRIKFAYRRLHEASAETEDPNVSRLVMKEN